MIAVGFDFLLVMTLGFLIGYNTHAVVILTVDLDQQNRNYSYNNYAFEADSDIPIVNATIVENSLSTGENTDTNTNIIVTRGILVE